MAPTINKSLRETDDTISISWQKLTPDIALGLVTNYTISYKKENSGKTKRQMDANSEGGIKVVSGDESQAVLKPLEGKFGYSFVMWANTSAGKGRESSKMFVDGESML